MANQKWKIRLEFECNDYDDEPSQTVLELSGEHRGESGKRAVNECIAIDMGYIMLMLLAGGHGVGFTTFDDAADAFSDF